ncbi:hypothetical protein [Ferrimonas balearica]|uniref:hypothetical protein n=1 Tax=Ferrimonas balearica TaxID=44012 RepID=UPI001C990D5A|nr:hypothetical protein [Ferrimonas balearica]MBY5994032.1 hypothetical protein [Ferrimonas balearica]
MMVGLKGSVVGVVMLLGLSFQATAERWEVDYGEYACFASWESVTETQRFPFRLVSGVLFSERQDFPSWFRGQSRFFAVQLIEREGVNTPESLELIAGTKQLSAQMRVEMGENWYLLVDQSAAKVWKSILSGEDLKLRYRGASYQYVGNIDSARVVSTMIEACGK